MVIGEGGSFAEGMFNIAMSLVMGDDASKMDASRSDDNATIQSTNSTESLQPRHSVKEALRQSSSIGEIDNPAMDHPTEELVKDFISMLEQGLYVFANVVAVDDNDISGDGAKSKTHFEGGFKLGILSYTKEERGAFLISPVAAAAGETTDPNGSSPVKLQVDGLKPLRSAGSQGIDFPSDSVKAEVVLSDESDRDVLLNGLNACLPCMGH